MHIISEGDVIVGHPLASRRVFTFFESTYSYPSDVYKSINDSQRTSDRRYDVGNCHFAVLLSECLPGDGSFDDSFDNRYFVVNCSIIDVERYI